MRVKIRVTKKDRVVIEEAFIDRQGENQIIRSTKLKKDDRIYIMKMDEPYHEYERIQLCIINGDDQKWAVPVDMVVIDKESAERMRKLTPMNIQRGSLKMRKTPDGYVFEKEEEPGWKDEETIILTDEDMKGE